jgi:hypothetical protein
MTPDNQQREKIRSLVTRPVVSDVETSAGMLDQIARRAVGRDENW